MIAPASAAAGARIVVVPAGAVAGDALDGGGSGGIGHGVAVGGKSVSGSTPGVAAAGDNMAGGSNAFVGSELGDWVAAGSGQ